MGIVILKRRQFLQGSLALTGVSLLSGCGLLSSPGPANAPPRSPRVGLLWRASPVGNQQYVQAFHDGLDELGYVDGRNIVLEHRSAVMREERLPELAAELVRLPVDVIVTGQVVVAMAATATIPIVGVPLDSDPIGQGQIANFAHPGGNLTGLTFNIPGEGGKRLELLKATVPGLSRVAILKPLASPPLRIDDVEEAARALQVELRVREVALPGGFQTVFEAMVSGGDQAFMVPSSIVFLDDRNRVRLAELAIQHRLPWISLHREHAEDGGLLAYASSLTALWKRAASYVDKILKGARPTDLPVERPTTFDFLINLKTAQALGLTIPPSVLSQATEVIQ
jgi:putative ABC transport system substrate-binding protein